MYPSHLSDVTVKIKLVVYATFLISRKAQLNAERPTGSEDVLLFFQISVPLPEYGLFSMSSFWVEDIAKLMKAKCCILVIGFFRKKILVLDSTKFNESGGKGYIAVAPFL